MRIRVHSKDRTFLARKGSTLKEMQSWKAAYNKHNRDKVGKLEVVKDRKPVKSRRNTSPFGQFGGGFKIPKFR